MQKSTNAENKRVKHWQRTSAAGQAAKSRLAASSTKQPVNAGSQPQAEDPTPEGDTGASTVAKSTEEPGASLRRWDNEGGGTVTPDPPKPMA